MALNLTGLSAYTDQNSGILIGRAILGANLLNYANVQPGYSAGVVNINVLNLSQMVFGSRACSWTDTGTVSYEQVGVTCSSIQSKQSLCLNDLRGYWLAANMEPGAYTEQYPLEQFLADEVVKATRLNFEQHLATQIIPGFTASRGSVYAIGASASVGTASILSSVDALIDALPEGSRTREDLHIWMSYPTFRTLNRALVSANYFHYDANAGNQIGTGMGQYVLIPGTNVKAVPVAGFGSSQKMICGPKEHFVIVTGLTDDQDKISIWYSKDNDQIRMMSAYRAGFGAVYSSFSENGRN